MKAYILLRNMPYEGLHENLVCTIRETELKIDMKDDHED